MIKSRQRSAFRNQPKDLIYDSRQIRNIPSAQALPKEESRNHPDVRTMTRKLVNQTSDLIDRDKFLSNRTPMRGKSAVVSTRNQVNKTQIYGTYSNKNLF